MILVIVLIIAVIIVGFLVSNYNTLVRGKNRCEEAFSTMDVYLKKRFDLIPNLVSTVKGYAAHEVETLEKVIAGRNLGVAQNTEDRIKNENQISGALRNIFALAEGYPDLKANENFNELQKQLESIEEDIANARKYYNGCVRDFNNKVMEFPSNIIACVFHFEKQPMFSIPDNSERDNVRVEF